MQAEEVSADRHRSINLGTVALFLLTLVLFVFWASWQRLDSWRRVSHTHEVLATLGKVRNSLIGIESAPPRLCHHR